MTALCPYLAHLLSWKAKAAPVRAPPLFPSFCFSFRLVCLFLFVLNPYINGGYDKSTLVWIKVQKLRGFPMEFVEGVVGIICLLIALQY